MSKYQLRIKLLSDMCVADGGVYNSSVDVDICYDACGFPYIPSKRIRGCLRECAIELQDWGVDCHLEELFGSKGERENRAAMRMGNACLAGYETMRQQAEERTGHIVFHPQNILNHFTYLRTQTSIDYETGVADATTLRTMRVANKGLEFVADVEMDERYQEELEKCCKVFRHMGVSRTRGLGEIEVFLEKCAEEHTTSHQVAGVHQPYQDGAQILHYQICLEEPVICKSVNGGQEQTLDYIEGSKILGLLFEAVRGEDGDFLSVMEQEELFCSNAYIAREGIRYTEVPAYIYSMKNDKAHYVNKLYPDPSFLKDEDLQVNMMKHCYTYMDDMGKLYRQSVRIEERYHHRRPEDKSIGRAKEDASRDSQFYQMSAIEAGQTFQGFIQGSQEQIKEIYNLLSEKSSYYIGYSRSSQYGKVRLQITGTEQISPQKTVRTQDFLVKLNAPAIVYNKNAFYSTDVNDLIAEVNALLDIEPEMVDAQKDIRCYLHYTTVGGYNTTWRSPKPIIVAFDKGTVLRYHLKEAVDLHIPPMLVIGERITEGFGEAVVSSIENVDGDSGLREIHVIDRKDERFAVDAMESEFSYAICEDLFKDYVRMQAALDAKKDKMGVEYRPTVSNMLLMCSENETYEKIRESTEERYGKATEDKAKKLKYADRILEKAKTNAQCVTGMFCDKYNVTHFEYQGDVRKLYLESYLKQMKYNFRQMGGSDNEQ